MNLDRVTVNIRPRSTWEAIDLGFVLARRWYWPLLRLWLAAALPFLLFLTVLVFLVPGPVANSNSTWLLLLFWLGKPFYEPPMLNWLSRALFGERESFRTTMREVKNTFTRRRLLTLLLTRFSLNRSFSLPVLQLEGLERKQRKERLAILADGSGGTIFLTAAGMFIEIILTVSLMTVLYWFVPENMRWVDFGDFIFRPDSWLLIFCYAASCALFAPIYSCSGFMLYISRRVHLEAWDLEIGFKRIRQRLGRQKNGIVQLALALIFCVSVLFTLLPQNCGAIPPAPETVKETVTEILKQRDFGEKVTAYRWEFKEVEVEEKDSDWAEFFERLLKELSGFLETIGVFLALYGEILIWCLAGGVIAFLLIRYAKIRDWLGGRSGRVGGAYAPPKTLFGLDVRPESLPDDLGTACQKLLDEGRGREAISLLYRGTLSEFINRHHLSIQPSFTENECCNAVSQSRPEQELQYFKGLTSLWVLLAYGHRAVETEVCRGLIGRYVALFQEQS